MQELEEQLAASIHSATDTGSIGRLTPEEMRRAFNEESAPPHQHTRQSTGHSNQKKMLQGPPSVGAKSRWR